MLFLCSMVDRGWHLCHRMHNCLGLFLPFFHTSRGHAIATKGNLGLISKRCLFQVGLCFAGSAGQLWRHYFRWHRIQFEWKAQCTAIQNRRLLLSTGKSMKTSKSAVDCAHLVSRDMSYRGIIRFSSPVTKLLKIKCKATVFQIFSSKWFHF